MQEGGTALIYAININSETDTVRVLVEAGADLDIADNVIRICAHAHKHRDTTPPTRLLLIIRCAHPSPDFYMIFAFAQCGETALTWATCMGKTDVVMMLIKAGADLNIKTKV